MEYPAGIPLRPRNENGNALFLILIAVALFAALSYAITQSGRGGGSTTASETGTINAGLITDYAASIGSTVTRMIVTSNIAANAIDYTNGDTGAGAVFDATLGGGAIWVTAPPANAQDTAAIDGAHAGPNWRFKAVTSTFNKGYYIYNLGNGTSASGQDAFAFVGVTAAACTAINNALGTPIIQGEAFGATAFDTTFNATESLPTHALGWPSAQFGAHSQFTIGKYYGLEVTPEAFACISNSGITTGPFLYYHALVEQ